MTANSHNYSKILLTWYDQNGRDLPWRNTRDPYKIWLSEIILQQTRVDQGMAYFFAFTDQFKTVKDLANAPQEAVLKTWQGLGYYSRARNLHATAQEIAFNRNGEFPKSAKELKELKGIGPYTSAAIASIAFGEVIPVVDGNVYRWITRLFGIDLPIDQKDGQKAVQEIVEAIIPEDRPADFNQAMMDFGATLCSQKKPNCEACPFKQYCIAQENQLTDILPIKAKKTKVQTVYLNYFVLEHKKQIIMKQRPGSGIWAGLNDFPLIESEEKMDETQLIDQAEAKFLFSDGKLLSVSPQMKHLLSHRKLFAQFYWIKLNTAPEFLPEDHYWCAIEDLDKKPLPKLIENYWKTR